VKCVNGIIIGLRCELAEDEFSRIPTIGAEIRTSPYPMCSLLSCEPRLHEVRFTRCGRI